MKDFLLYNDEELIQEIKADNMLAFDALYKKYCKRVYGFGYSILKSQEQTENLIQDVFVTFWENRYNIEKGSSIKSYLFSITYNSAISCLRRLAKESRFIEYLKSQQQNYVEPASVDIEYNELKSKLEEIIKNLPERQREVYLLHRVEGLKLAEIAEKLHISVNTIENHMSHALKAIRKKLGRYPLVAILFWQLFVSY